MRRVHKVAKVKKILQGISAEKLREQFPQSKAEIIKRVLDLISVDDAYLEDLYFIYVDKEKF